MSSLGWEGAFYRGFFGVGALVMFSAAWKLWRRSRHSWRWFGAAVLVCGSSWLVFERIKMVEELRPMPEGQDESRDGPEGWGHAAPE